MKKKELDQKEPQKNRQDKKRYEKPSFKKHDPMDSVGQVIYYYYYTYIF
jgi:hypothetical protein